MVIKWKIEGWGVGKEFMPIPCDIVTHGHTKTKGVHHALHNVPIYRATPSNTGKKYPYSNTRQKIRGSYLSASSTTEHDQ